MAGEIVLVAGAGGFIGGHLVAALRARGQRVRAVDKQPLCDWHQRCDDAENLVLDLTELDACMEACCYVDHVYDLAADTGGLGFVAAHKAACMLSVRIGAHLLLAARDRRVQRFFFASSACVYNAHEQDRPDVTALREDDVYPALPEDGYGWEKLFTERLCRHFTEDFGLATRVARFDNVYGPCGTFAGGREQAPAALCRKVQEAVESGSGELEIWGDGSQTRSFLYVDDCIDGMLALMQSRVTEPRNIGSEAPVSIDQLATMVEEIAGVRLRRRYRPDAPRGVMGRNSANTLARRDLGWEPKVSLRDGLARTYAWIARQRGHRGQNGERAVVLPAAPRPAARAEVSRPAHVRP